MLFHNHSMFQKPGDKLPILMYDMKVKNCAYKDNNHYLPISTVLKGIQN